MRIYFSGKQGAEMPGITDFVRMEESASYRGPETGDGGYQPFYVNYQQVQPIRNAFYRVHASPDYEMIIPREKTYRCLLDDRPVKVKKGEFLIVHAHQRHQDLFSTDAPYHTFHFRMCGSGVSAPLENLFAGGLLPQCQVAELPDPRQLNVIVQLLRRELKGVPQPETFHICNSLFRSIFWKCISGYPPEHLSGLFRAGFQNRRMTAHLIRIFECNLTEMPDLDALCREAGMSRSSLNRLTNELFALPPRKAFLKYKIHRAQQLLASDPTRKLKELSDYLHFENQFHFSRIFKRYALYPPSKFRMP